MTKVLHLAPAVESHEEIFMARYERLRRWALHLCANDHALAEDLIQEAFVQFTLTNAELQSIHNLDAYLFGLLRILHLSQLRRSKNRAQLLRMVLDYDAAALGLRAADPRAEVIMRDQLQKICRYACARKETSKAGSVLLLRFFLGYYPGEIARLSACTRAAVEERLRLARAEAKAYLDDPDGLKVFGAAPSAPAAAAAPCDLTRPADAFLHDLRRQIYQSRGGTCLNVREWRSLYAEGGAVECATMSHLASCPDCLDAVNGLLGLPPLRERHPVDTLGRDTRGGGDDDDGPTGGAGSGGKDEEARRCRQRAREVMGHSPQELSVAVNGHVVGSQRVSSAHSEQTLNINEDVDFVEVFSEQDVRLLLLPVGEQPPDGPFRHSARINLDDGRRLTANLSLNYPASTLQVIYRNPLWQTEAAGAVFEAEAEMSSGRAGTSPVAESLPGVTPDGAESGFDTVLPGGLLAWLRRQLSSYQLWLRPGTVAVALSLLLISALFLIRWRGRSVSAAELLVRSVAAERALGDDHEAVTNRVFYLEKSGEPAVRRRVEIWQSAARGLTVRRVFDERNQPVIAEWLKADGTRTVLSPGSKPSSSVEAQPRPGELLEAGALWRLNPSADVFLELTGQAEGARVEEQPETYTVSYRGNSSTQPRGGIIEAALVIRKADLHALELRMSVVREGEVREYRFVESLYTRKPAVAVPDSVFEIESAAGETRPAGLSARGGERVAAPSNSSSPTSPTASAPAASAELEVEVNYLLHRIKANLGEQVTVERTPGGRLRVEAMAETEARKNEILKSLGPVAGNPFVEVAVSTVAEALKRRKGKPAAPTSVLEIAVADDARDVDAELRSRFGDDARTDEAILRLSARAINHSRRAVQHAAALKRLTASFSLQKSGALDAPAREKLLAMIRAHAEGYAQNAQALRRELLPLAPGGDTGEGGGAAAITGDVELARAVERLLQLSRSNDEAVRSAFALSAQGQSLDAVKSTRFWASLGAAEALSRTISQAYR